MPDRRPFGVADGSEANALKGGHMSLTSGLLAAVTSDVNVAEQ